MHRYELYFITDYLHIKNATNEDNILVQNRNHVYTMLMFTLMNMK